jgi:Na+-transporting methylmalonyl-CoA/oxaloacetate decarboxylase gamma subunit
MNTELLLQGGWLTLVGMGFTFISIGAIIGVMYLITAVIKDKPEAEEETAEALVTEVDSEAAARRLAAVAAVTVALAQAQSPQQALPVKDWDIYARNQRLTSSALHDMQRVRR